MRPKISGYFSQTDTSVLTIDVERTFWEKLTILHKIANFPEGKSLPARYARHLYDVYNMGNSWVKESAFKRKELLEKDVAFKQKFYYAKGAHYETATLSSIELLPKEAVLNALKEDYQAMSNMIYGNIPEFEDILAFLKKLQSEIHELSNTNCKVVKMYNQKIIKKIKRCAKEGSYDELLNYIEGVQWTSKDGTYVRFFEVIRR